MRTIVVAAILLVALCGAIRFNQNPSPPRYADPDKHGYRFCASWKLDDGTPIYSGCDPYELERCGKTLGFDYRCCSGFQKSGMPLGGASSNPCGKVVPQFDDCPSVIESLGFSRFASYLRNMPELTRKNGQPFTIFVPLPEDGSGTSSGTAAYHVAKGRHYADDLKSGIELESVHQNQKIHISRTSFGSVNVECVEMSEADIECSSGVIHIIRQPLTPRSGFQGQDKSSVMSLLRSNADTRDFANSLQSKLQQDLGRVEEGKTYTVTAPTSSSWSQLKGKYSKEQLELIAASHVSTGRKCSSNMHKSEQAIRMFGGQKFSVKCSVGPNGKEVRQIVDACGAAHSFTAGKSDLMAANGVVHILDDPIIPPLALTLKDFLNRPECAKYQNIDKFMDILKECDLYMNDADQYAVIAPENGAFDWWKTYKKFQEEYQRFQTDKDYRCRVARYHVVKHEGGLANMATFDGHTDGHRSQNKNDYLYETSYFTKGKMGSTLNFHYSPVNGMDAIALKGSSIYRTSRINVIPEKNISQIVGERSDLSHSNNIMNIAKMEEKVFSKNAPKNLYLVTTDNGWIDPRSAKLGKKLMHPELARYEGVPELAENYAKLGHVPLYLWGDDIGYFEKNSVQKFMSSAGVELIFWMDEQGVMRIGYEGLPKSEWPKVVEYNLPGQDGITWLLDGILKCPPSLCPMELEDTDIYTFFTAACLSSDLPGEKDVKKAFSKNPTEIAKRHPDKCLVIKQGAVTTTKDIFEGGPVADHEH